ncbi:MAG: hypothetical protein IT439_02560 [Phycisphaerales bacterium]|nr:hypothetical protein [Phycisphaerales bacterium]
MKLPLVLALLAAPALGDFAGQPILGPLTNGSVVNGDTTGASDDNDGFTSGMHIFNLWEGGDDVWRLDWLGGGMTVELFYDTTFSDLELFVYRPSNLDDSGDYSIVNSGYEVVHIPSAPAGSYYINIDSPAFMEGAYRLAVTPAPSTLALLGLASLASRRRR